MMNVGVPMAQSFPAHVPFLLDVIYYVTILKKRLSNEQADQKRVHLLQLYMYAC